jgi:hypothetical protein
MGYSQFLGQFTVKQQKGILVISVGGRLQRVRLRRVRRLDVHHPLLGPKWLVLRGKMEVLIRKP